MKESDIKQVTELFDENCKDVIRLEKLQDAKHNDVLIGTADATELDIDRGILAQIVVSACDNFIRQRIEERRRRLRTLGVTIDTP